MRTLTVERLGSWHEGHLNAFDVTEAFSDMSEPDMDTDYKAARGWRVSSDTFTIVDGKVTWRKKPRKRGRPQETVYVVVMSSEDEPEGKDDSYDNDAEACEAALAYVTGGNDTYTADVYRCTFGSGQGMVLTINGAIYSADKIVHHVGYEATDVEEGCHDVEDFGCEDPRQRFYATVPSEVCDGPVANKAKRFL